MDAAFYKELERIDEIFDQNRLRETIQELKALNKNDNVEVLWRLARVCFQLSKFVPSKSEQMEHAEKGLEYVKQALATDDNSSYAHCWYAILLDKVSDLRGLRERAMQLKEVKHHMVRAIELNPHDPLSRHTLGMFMFTLAELNWIKRKAVEVIYAKPPEGTFAGALELFLAAEEIEPNFYSVNKLMIAKCYIALKNYEAAKEYLRKAAALEPIKNDDDVKSVQEAKSLLLKL